jgi:hypothetical protein
VEKQKVSRKEEAVPRRTEAAPVPTSLGESLETGCGFTISDAAALLAKHQEAIRQRIPRKDTNGPAVNVGLRDLDRMLQRFVFTRADLSIISIQVELARKAWEIEQERRSRYTNKWIRP